MNALLSSVPRRVFLALAALAPCSPSFADLDPANPLEVTQVQVRNIAGKFYFEVTGLMNGRILGIPVRTYRVPVTVLFPRQPAQQSRTAVVDCLNNTAFKLFFLDTFDPGDPSGTPAVPPFPIARIMLGEEFLAARGDTYVAVQHDKQAIEMYESIGQPVGPGAHVGSFFGENTVIADVSRLLRNPPPALISLQPAEHTIAFGESASASDLTEFFFELDFPSSYDGALMQSACGLACGDAPADKKFILVNTETDVQINQAALSRPGHPAPPNYRVFEVAGASHNPIEQIGLEELARAFDPAYLATIPSLRQNPAPISPVMRAMYDHMRGWVAGGPPPPPSVFLAGPGPPQLEVLPNFFGDPTPTLVTDPWRDGDGNAIGGVRLPHVRTSANGSTFGAPLGTLNGLERDVPFDSRGFGVMISGTLEVFPGIVLAFRYPNHQSYVDDVTDAADYALSHGWITAQDRAAYVHAAVECDAATSGALTYDEAVDCMNP